VLVPFAFADTPAKNCGCACCTGKEVCCCHPAESANAKENTASAKEDNGPAAARHALRGVIVDVRPKQSALLVKHETIPGYMRGMTMLFKVDQATLETAKKGQAITATLVEREDSFWLEDVKSLPQ
ncbi:MAG TPA: copper-binding protein, partial [Opitutus sp.]|nr:copper-binding protein [Opitutus sp.]